MESVGADIYRTRLVAKMQRTSRYNMIYFYSNDELSSIFSNFDFKDKDILTVLGSGDQAFHLYNLGAHSVDVFDINKLTIYYYYLRRWTIKYLNKLYPDFNLSNRFISQLLDLVNISDCYEQKAYDYWRRYTKKFEDEDVDLLFYRKLLKPLIVDISNLSNITKIMDKDHFNFYNVDISKKIDIDSQYDVIYTSNLSDYIRDNNSFEIYRDNLYKLLKKDGVVLSSNVVRFGSDENQKRIFQSYFDYYDLPKIKTSYFSEGFSPGYCYIKK